jgi:hypothetical protein
MKNRVTKGMVGFLGVMLLALSLTAIPAHAQEGLNPRRSANFGSVSLRAGFIPDPYRVEMISGGSVDVDDFFTADSSSDCRGYASSAPDFELRWSGNSHRLEFDFDGRGDTVMIINDPLGNWYCDDDDGPGLDPELSFSYPRVGTYDIWIASYSPDDFIVGTLEISEIAD